jgi:4-diphosphocytidyl-2-C-methyl-D-erythritol kinase
MFRDTRAVKTVNAVTRAKVNLSLEVIRRRGDGYHEIETILQSIDLHDELSIALTSDGKIVQTCSNPAVPTDERNLCHRALVAMRRYAGDSLGARIHIQKNIPPGSGLGGGSANAAGVILSVDRALRLGVPMRQLETLAAELGSDVPFMLHGGTMLGRGRGEKLTPLEPLKGGFFTIVRPNLTISTAWAYKNFSFALTKHRPRINLKSVNAVLARFPGVVVSFRNALEDVVCPAYPVVSGVLGELISTRPSFASMTGSGSALYAVYDSEAKAVKVAERFSVRGFYSSVAKPAKRAIDIFDSKEQAR